MCCIDHLISQPKAADRSERIHAMKIANFVQLAGLCLFISACSNESDFSMGHATMNCEESKCLVALDVTNTSDEMLPLKYEFSLSQNYIRDPNKSGLVTVGAADGAIDLPPNETKSIEIEIEVTETPNGFMGKIFDSRTPEFIFEILGF